MAQFNWLDDLMQRVEKKPLVVLSVSDSDWEPLHTHISNLEDEFSIAVRSDDMLEGVRKGTICLIASSHPKIGGLFLGIISSKYGGTTFQKKINIIRVVKIHPDKFDDLLKKLSNKRHNNNLERRLLPPTSAVLLSAKLSSYLVGILSSDEHNIEPLKSIFEEASKSERFTGTGAMQQHAIALALRAIGLSSDSKACFVDGSRGVESGLLGYRVLEDSAIEHDARSLAGYTLHLSDITGKAIFAKDGKKLEVYTVNKRPLEEVFGVDLIYHNIDRQNVVMLQYKMLEPTSDDDWVYYPDKQFYKEIIRMHEMAKMEMDSEKEYRLNASPFFLKFVRRYSHFSGYSMILPLDHYETIKASSVCKGPRGGVRISYNALAGSYLRETPFISLLGTGYIGTKADTTKKIIEIIEMVLQHGKAAVVAIQRAIR